MKHIEGFTKYLGDRRPEELADMLTFGIGERQTVDVFAGTLVQLIRVLGVESGYPIIMMGEGLSMYTGKKYVPLDDDTIMYDIIEPLVQACNLDGRKTYDVSFAKKFKKYAADVLSARSVFKRSLKPAPGLVFSNGRLTLESGKPKLIPGNDPRWLNTTYIDTPWKGVGNGPRTPTWDKFLPQAVPDAEFRDYMCAHLGNAISMDPMGAQRALILVGIGGAGKSTILMAMEGIVGEEATATVTSLGKLTEKDGLFAANLESSTLCIASDSGASVRDKEALKNLISKEPVSVTLKYMNPRKIMPRSSILVASNDNQLSFLLTDTGLARRLDIIKFKAAVKASERNPHLGRDLVPEYPGIAHKLAEAMIEHAAGTNGRLLRPEAMERMVQEDAMENDVVAAALHSAGLRVSHEDLDVGLYDTELFAYFFEYLKNNGENTTTKRSMNKRLEGLNAYATRGGGNKRVWRFKVFDKQVFQSSNLIPVK